MFREVSLPEAVPGRMFLHSMPGRHEPIDDTLRQLRTNGISEIVCLAGSSEISQKIP